MIPSISNKLYNMFFKTIKCLLLGNEPYNISCTYSNTACIRSAIENLTPITPLFAPFRNIFIT